MIFSPLAVRPHALYRFFDSGGRLLYVGITANLPNRIMHHNGIKPWWCDVSDIKLEHYPSRATVLEAERRAIINEHPLHNVIHNQNSSPDPNPIRLQLVDTDDPRWTFRSHCSELERTTPLYLYWEVNCDPISDDYYVDEIDAEELWRVWLTRYPRDESAEAIYGQGAVSIHWFVEGDATLEGAPFRDTRASVEGFRRHGWSSDDSLTYEQEHQFLNSYTWPVNAVTGERVQWSRLPVIDKVWRKHDLPKVYVHKGGFIQEATGWKPSAFQPYVNVRQMAHAAGLYSP